ncbi:hypothetical protein BDR04DRAFT_406634 [Suillus decipiens]|nr:hypothetical protein BDR04DRAFT_406634 [Suillus decipiens]
MLSKNMTLLSSELISSCLIMETSKSATSLGLAESFTEGTTDLSCIELINQYRLGQSGKANTILAIRGVLLKYPAVTGRSGRNVNDALDVFIEMLDGINSFRAQAAERGRQLMGNSKKRILSEIIEVWTMQKRPRQHESSQWMTLILSRKFPWSQRRSSAIASII